MSTFGFEETREITEIRRVKIVGTPPVLHAYKSYTGRMVALIPSIVHIAIKDGSLRSVDVWGHRLRKDSSVGTSVVRCVWDFDKHALFSGNIDLPEWLEPLIAGIPRREEAINDENDAAR